MSVHLDLNVCSPRVCQLQYIRATRNVMGYLLFCSSRWWYVFICRAQLLPARYVRFRKYERWRSFVLPSRLRYLRRSWQEDAFHGSAYDVSCPAAHFKPLISTHEESMQPDANPETLVFLTDHTDTAYSPYPWFRDCSQ